MPNPQAQLVSWAAQRDALLGEVAGLKVQKEALTKENNELAASHTEIKRNHVDLGARLEELGRKEQELVNRLTLECVQKGLEKQTLESELASLRALVAQASEHLDTLNKTVESSRFVHEHVVGKSEFIQGRLDSAVETNRQVIKDIADMLGNLKSEVQQLHDINAENAKKTNHLIAELPRILFDIQRPETIKIANNL